MSIFISFEPKLIKTLCTYKKFVSSRHNFRGNWDIVKEDVNIIVIQTSPEEEISIRKTGSSEKQG